MNNNLVIIQRARMKTQAKTYLDDANDLVSALGKVGIKKAMTYNEYLLKLHKEGLKDGNRK